MLNRRAFASLIVGTIAAVGTSHAHTMFLKLESFILEPDSAVRVQLIDGDFNLSENAISRDRMLDVSIVGPAGRTHPPISAWRDAAVYDESEAEIDTSILTFETGVAGTYVLGVSTASRVFTLSGEEFDGYLEHDGIVDVIAARKLAGRSGEQATERYSKHVKAFVQVGDRQSDEFSRALGYPLEFVPLENPYELGVGDDLRVRLLREGAPVANHLVYASHDAYHKHGDEGGHEEAVETRTDAEGIATIPLIGVGRWYVRSIHMSEPTSEPEVDYISNWATLTFGIR